ncbi:MAG: hypothetical protein IJ375_02890 [Oscillospiraceae bacterium]|nr:hypothetical protein [Oscillospiraceae bacterium]
MGKKILELVFQDKRDLIDHTCDMIRKCLQTARPQGVTLSNIVGKMERIKFKKEMLLEMRTDGEITKQEFLDQRKKLDKELQELQAEYDSKAYNPVIEMDQPEWGKIQTALEEILDLSQPTPSPDLIRKFVAQIVPEGKTNFQWHLNLDGNQTTHVGMTVEGRKNKAVVSFATEGTCSPLAFGAVIEYPTLCRAAADKNAYLSAMQDRLRLRAKIYPIIQNRRTVHPGSTPSFSFSK